MTATETETDSFSDASESQVIIITFKHLEYLTPSKAIDPGRLKEQDPHFQDKDHHHHNDDIWFFPYYLHGPRVLCSPSPTTSFQYVQRDYLIEAKR